MPRPFDPNVVIDRVGEWYHLDPVAMRTTRHRVHIVRARRTAVVLVARLCGCSLRVAARHVGYTVGDGGSFTLLKTWVDKTQPDLFEVEQFVKEAP